MANTATIDLDALDKEISEVQGRLDTLRAVRQYAATRQPSSSQPLPVKSGAAPSVARDVPAPSGGGRYDDLPTPKAVETVLRERGRPMKATEICEQLRSEGYGENLKRLPNSVHSALTKKNGPFRKNERGEWEFANPFDVVVP